jgi:hypothetical protein
MSKVLAEIHNALVVVCLHTNIKQLHGGSLILAWLVSCAPMRVCQLCICLLTSWLRPQDWGVACCRVPSQANMQAVEAAVNSVSASTGAWGTTITGVKDAIAYMANLQTPANNPFTSEAASVLQLLSLAFGFLGMLLAAVAAVASAPATCAAPSQ